MTKDNNNSEVTEVPELGSKITYVASTYVLRPRSLNRVYGISESRSDRSNSERKRDRERDRDRSELPDNDSEQRCLIRLQTEVLP